VFSAQNDEKCDIVMESLCVLPRVSYTKLLDGFQLNLAFDGSRPKVSEQFDYTHISRFHTLEYMMHEDTFITSLKNTSSYGKLALTDKLIMETSRS
jgi:hypothetical protein